MFFEWDETKNRINVRKHGFDFVEAEEMFRGALLVRPDTPGGLRRKAVDWDWHDSGPSCLCRIRGVSERHDPHHLIEKGRS